jgi:hypothetical protein
MLKEAVIPEHRARELPLRFRDPIHELLHAAGMRRGISVHYVIADARPQKFFSFCFMHWSPGTLIGIPCLEMHIAVHSEYRASTIGVTI